MVTIKRLDLEKSTVKVQSQLVKPGQTQSNLIDGLETIRLCEIHIRILIIGIEKYGDILVLVKFETNQMVRLRKHSHIGTQHMSITRHTQNYSHSIFNAIGGSIEIKLPTPWFYISWFQFYCQTSSSRKRDSKKSGSLNG